MNDDLKFEATDRLNLYFSVAKNDEGRRFMHDLAERLQSDGKWRVLEVREPHDKDRIYFKLDAENASFILRWFVSEKA